MTDSLRYLNAIRAFDAAARHSSFAKAAKELNVSHSVISQHIRNLEEGFCVNLFTRFGNRVELSEDGKMFLPHVSRAFIILNDACDNLRKISPKGTIVIGAEPGIAGRWLRKKITEFGREFPDVEVILKPSWDAPVLGESSLDMIIHFEGRHSVSDSTVLSLFPITGFWACSPEYYEKNQLSIENNDINSLQFIHDNRKELWQQWFTQYEPDNNAWNKGKVYSDLALAIDASVDGEGIILADKIICKRELDSGTLIQIDHRNFLCTNYQVETSKDLANHSPVILFRDWLIDLTKCYRAE